MNGQTGKFVGDMPVGKAEYWKWRLIYSAAFSAIAWLILFLFFH